MHRTSEKIGLFLLYRFTYSPPKGIACCPTIYHINIIAIIELEMGKVNEYCCVCSSTLSLYFFIRDQ